ncbi:hypothetical protein ACE4RR_16885 [Alteribacillus sp. HJP-4]
MFIPDKSAVHRRMKEFEKEASNYRWIKKNKKKKKQLPRNEKDAEKNKVKTPA